MSFNRRSYTSNSPGLSTRGLVMPPRPVDGPQPGSPISDDSSFFGDGTETIISLTSPWPPTPPRVSSPLASPTIYDPSGSREKLLAYTSKPANRNYNRLIRMFSLTADKTPIQFMIAVAPVEGKPNHHTFSLSYKAGGVHRGICEPVTLKLAFDPRQLTFNVFLFPPKQSLPKNCLYSLRVWLRHQYVGQRIFADNALWVGTDPDFATIPDSILATGWNQAPDRKSYRCLLGRAEVNFILRWEQLEGSIYALALEYEAGGVGKALFENMIVRLDFPPHTLSCHIYTIPLISKPAGATHRVRIWLKTPSPFNTAEDSHRSYTYQRIWSTDEFRVGGFLDFQDIDPKRVILATPLERPPLRLRTTASPRPGPVGR